MVVILGPTGVGKSEIAIELAGRFNAEIVSADSRLFYRGMDIGTAKPTKAERQCLPHHLIDVAEPDETWSLGVFQREAHRTIREVFSKGYLPFLVGGTGQFVRAISEGWSIPPVEPNMRLREALNRWAIEIGALQLHQKLAMLDPEAAGGIDPTNLRRTIRALEVILSTGRPFSAQRRRGVKFYNSLLIGLTCPRAELYRRIDERISEMLEAGFVNEVRRLLEQGYSADLPTMSAIGYAEMVAYLHGKITLDEAIRLMQHRTRRFVRRQANWFKEDDPTIHWFQRGETTLDEMGLLIEKWLSSLNWHPDHL
ncbi:MAG: tRNA (adenosine(37)-N6)-dimethylallyltransferase MiaA [Chloroflexi bacterium RBG_16_54_11]|nr:MAG: tRNA (adenosine(37)-N6)-dimethylallyltransferase MiaA [Chloroflexi bacterium RBG_16_54_11]